MKTCKKCQQTKALTEFFNEKGFKDGKMAICKPCKQAKTYAWRAKNQDVYNSGAAEWRKKNPEKQHATEIKRNYGLPIEEYNRLLTEQKCQCAICGKQHDPSLKRGRLYVDHDHATSAPRTGKVKVRGLLCGACNSAIGYFNDNEELLVKAITYLKKAA